MSEWMTPAGLTAVAGLVSAVAWPITIFVLALVFRPQLKHIVHGLIEFEIFGVKGKIQKELDQSAQAVERKGFSEAPSPGELERAVQVEKLTSKIDLSFVRQQIDALAADYERIRASMRSSDTRTRAMEVVVSKMRTIGRAAYPLRHELSISPSPGRRLQAIASLQVIPDYDDFIDWLVDRIDTEKPFIAYHALVALNTAAADVRAADHLVILKHALARAREKAAGISLDTDRQRLLAQFQEKIESLRKSNATR